jgi:hypothetical protein
LTNIEASLARPTWQHVFGQMELPLVADPANRDSA